MATLLVTELLMTELLILRHGPTAWNAARRLQGHIDEPLSDDGRRRVRTWRLPPGADSLHWVASPLARAWETALILGLTPVAEPRLREMSWGAWEGRTVPELAAAGLMAEAHDRQGLDFRPPGGESPRDVQARLRPWLAEVATSGRGTGAVAHAGVIRAVYSLATGWDLASEPAHTIRNACAHRFRLAADGTPTLLALNIAL